MSLLKKLSSQPWDAAHMYDSTRENWERTFCDLRPDRTHLCFATMIAVAASLHSQMFGPARTHAMLGEIRADILSSRRPKILPVVAPSVWQRAVSNIPFLFLAFGAGLAVASFPH